MRVLFLPESTSASVAILTRDPAGTLVRFTTVVQVKRQHSTPAMDYLANEENKSVIDDVTRSQNRSNFEIAISPSIFELEHRSKAQNFGNAHGYLSAIFTFRCHVR